MRWPLRLQIMLPMSLVMLVLLVGVSALYAYLSVQRTKSQIERQLRDVAGTLSEASFPLTDRVLTQMRGLSGADFVLADGAGKFMAGSSDDESLNSVPKQLPTDASGEISLARPTRVGDANYYYARVRVQRLRSSQGALFLHIFYPEQSYVEALREAVLPPVLAGALALALVVLTGIILASRVTHPLRQLRTQVDRIAEGDFGKVPLPRRDDEVRDLANSVNEMSGMLVDYEDRVRRNEQLRTLSQVAAGIAHQMRNAATGCRIALDLHRAECPVSEQSESMEVATRQLSLMEKYLQRFLSRGGERKPPVEDVNLAQLVEQVLPLVRPSAQHVRVQMQWDPPAGKLIVRGHVEELEQVVINLLLNAIEAASQNEKHVSPATVAVTVRQDQQRGAVIEITDTGAGPAAEVRERIFEPLVTEKPDGAGLGLSVALEIVRRQGGDIRWHRSDNKTSFLVALPLACRETVHVEAASG